MSEFEYMVNSDYGTCNFVIGKRNHHQLYDTELLVKCMQIDYVELFQ